MEEELILKCPFCGDERLDMEHVYNNAEKRNLYYIYCPGCDWIFTPQSAWAEDEIIERFKKSYKDNETLIDLLQERINFHQEAIERLRVYGEQFHDDIKTSEGQIIEAREIMRIVFEATN